MDRTEEPKGSPFHRDTTMSNEADLKRGEEIIDKVHRARINAANAEREHRVHQGPMCETWCSTHDRALSMCFLIEQQHAQVHARTKAGEGPCDANSAHKLLHEQRERLLKMMNSGEISLLDVTMELFITLGLLEQQIPIGTGR